MYGIHSNSNKKDKVKIKTNMLKVGEMIRSRIYKFHANTHRENLRTGFGEVETFIKGIRGNFITYYERIKYPYPINTGTFHISI